MNPSRLRSALAGGAAAARAAGALMRRNDHVAKRINEATQHDIKLELDVRCQRLIERQLSRVLPEAAILGEEGTVGEPGASLRWVVDPIDGTVNFTYGIPHACVSIALQERVGGGQESAPSPTADAYADGYRTVVGVVFDPFTDELWTATWGSIARLNGRVISVSARSKLAEAIVALGFAKQRATLNRMLPVFGRLIHRVRKIRIMGAAALSLTYVATGRFDAYVENGVRLWDIAAGGFILQRAGGAFWRREVDSDRTFEIRVSGPKLQDTLHRVHGRSKR